MRIRAFFASRRAHYFVRGKDSTAKDKADAEDVEMDIDETSGIEKGPSKPPAKKRRRVITDDSDSDSDQRVTLQRMKIAPYPGMLLPKMRRRLVPPVLKLL